MIFNPQSNTRAGSRASRAIPSTITQGRLPKVRVNPLLAKRVFCLLFCGLTLPMTCIDLHAAPLDNS